MTKPIDSKSLSHCGMVLCSVAGAIESKHSFQNSRRRKKGFVDGRAGGVVAVAGL